MTGGASSTDTVSAGRCNGPVTSWSASSTLPGMVACLTTLPVIGVPVLLGSLKGMDALLSVVQMPKGIPVATVAIDNAANAGLLAARLVGMNDEKVQKKLQKYQTSQKKKVAQMNREIKLSR